VEPLSVHCAGVESRRYDGNTEVRRHIIHDRFELLHRDWPLMGDRKLKISDAEAERPSAYPDSRLFGVSNTVSVCLGET